MFMTVADTTQPAPPFNWRAHLEIHPAAELFPLMSEAELKELADDIKANGLIEPIVGWASKDGVFVLDGRNRLDALAELGLLYETDDHHVGIKKWSGEHWSDRSGARIDGYDGVFRNIYDDGGRDPFEIALSLNVHRRHLTAEQKRDLIAKVIKLQPEKSDRQIASIVKVDHKTVGAVRSAKEGRGEIPHVEMRTDTKGRKQPAKKSKKAKLAFHGAGDLAVTAEVIFAEQPAVDDGPTISADPAKQGIPVFLQTQNRAALDSTTLSAKIRAEWSAAENAFEFLAAHTVKEIAAAIPLEDHGAKAILATEFANLFTNLAHQLKASGCDETPIANLNPTFQEVHR